MLVPLEGSFSLISTWGSGDGAAGIFSYSASFLYNARYPRLREDKKEDEKRVHLAKTQKKLVVR